MPDHVERAANNIIGQFYAVLKTIIASCGVSDILSICFSSNLKIKGRCWVTTGPICMAEMATYSLQKYLRLPLFLFVALLAGCFGDRVTQQCIDYFEPGDLGRFETKDGGMIYDPLTKLYCRGAASVKN